MVTVRSLAKCFGDLWAIKDLSFQINAGEFYCLLGPNGAGKTTTIKILCGLMKPTQGTVTIKGLDVDTDYLKVKKLIGVIPDTPFLYDNLTANEFLQFVGNIFGVTKKVLDEKVQYYLELFKLSDAQHMLLRELSHGMRQKIVYASNFLHNPSFFLIDEPLVGLDPASIHLIKRLLKEETAKGNSILMCTHILAIAEELADRIGILNNGTLIAEGNLSELKRNAPGESLEEIFLRLTGEQ